MLIRCGRLALATLTVVGAVASAIVLFGQDVASATTPGGTLYVSSSGTDTGTCRLSTHPCATITYAIAQANPNSTIDVGAGTFPEQFTIAKTLTIVGVAGQTNIVPTSLSPVDTDPNHSTTPYPVVDVTSGAIATLKNLTIDGTAAQSTFNSCGQDPIGIYLHDASGELKHVTVKNIAETAPTNASLFGCQSGIGVYVATDSGSSSLTMGGDTVTGYQKDGIACRDANTSCAVNNSVVTGVGPNAFQGANGIEVYGAADASVVDDTVTQNSYTAGGAGNQATGLLLLDDGIVNAQGNTLSGNDINAYLGSDGSGPHENGWNFTQNTVSTAADNVAGGEAGYGNGVDIDGTSNDVVVQQNVVKTSASSGIVLTGAKNVTVSGNTANSNGGDGIYVGGPGGVWGGPAPTTSTVDSVTGNTAKNNGGDGINADTDSSGSTFSGNTTKNNQRYDLEDNGTGNSWSSDHCTPAGDSHPALLCS
ncbi:MAG TPA: right-handed parallel beta-helix repeat-containing protein [Acidimicrobiales bacterium]|nr:right-handed parallel beta-helix repeat-containing protein [Acidimicrobiales bacterium]